MSPLEQVVPVRSLGLWEATCAVLARTTQGGGNVVAVVQGEGPMTEAVVKQAMQIMFDRHQTLRCRFTESGSVPRFIDDVQFEDVPLLVQHAQTEDELIGIWEQMVREPLPDVRRLWELRFVPTPDGSTWRLMIKMSHAIADGRSLIHVVDQLVQCAAEFINGSQSEPVNMLLPAHAEARVGERMDRLTYLKKFEEAGALVPRTPWLVDHEADLSSRRPRIALRQLDAPTTEHLRSRCHDHGVTVLEAIVGALAVIQAKHANHSNHIVDADFCVPVDMRRFFEPPADLREIQMAAYCLRVLLRDVRADDDPWDVGQRFHNDFVPQLTPAYLPPWDATDEDVIRSSEAWGAMEDHYSMGFCPTNIGVVPTLDHPPLRTHAVDMTAATQAGGYPILVPIMTHKGVLRTTFSWTEPLMEAQTAAAWMDDIWGLLTKMALG